MKFDMLNKILTPYKNKETLIQLVLLSAWVFFEYSLGNKFYAVFMIFFLLLLIAIRPPAFILVAVSVLVIVFFNTPIINTVTELKRSNLIAVSHIKPSLDKIFRPNTGEEVLPVQVQQMLSLLRSHHISSYQVVGQFTTDGLIMQRIVESAWPIKMETTSSYFFIALTEINNYPACKLIDQKEDVALAYCH